MEELLMIYEDKMEKSLANLGEEYATIRAGRANPHILDKIKIDYYGTPTPLQQVGNVSVPEARMICIQPWDASILKDIEHAINMSDVGINPTSDILIACSISLRIEASQGWIQIILASGTETLPTCWRGVGVP